ncbi:MAG: hypothetical protein ACODAJ_09105, partial [Planctomycetota bacterium]
MLHRHPRHGAKVKVVGAIIGVLVVIGYARIDRYERRVTGEDGTLFVTTYRRWGSRPIKRWIIFPEGGSLHGPTSE